MAGQELTPRVKTGLGNQEAVKSGLPDAVVIPPAGLSAVAESSPDAVDLSEKLPLAPSCWLCAGAPKVARLKTSSVW